MPKFPSQEAARFIVRLPDGMREKIADAARASGRSMNSEIVARLEKSFEVDDPIQELWRRITELESDIERQSIRDDERFDKVETRVWKLLEHAGLYDPNND